MKVCYSLHPMVCKAVNSFLALDDGNYSYREWQRKPDTDRLGFTIFKLISDNTKGKDFSL